MLLCVLERKAVFQRFARSVAGAQSGFQRFARFRQMSFEAGAQQAFARSLVAFRNSRFCRGGMMAGTQIFDNLVGC
jgi:hypothetical protein